MEKKLKEIKNKLKEKKFVIGIPVVIKFKKSNKRDFSKFKATKGTEVVKWAEILKALKESK